MKPTIFFITLVIITAFVTTTSRAQGNSTYVKVADADLPQVQAAWNSAIAVEKDKNHLDFPANDTVICAWSTNTSNMTTYWGMIYTLDDYSKMPYYREVTFNDQEVTAYDVPEPNNSPYGCAEQSAILCPAGPEKSKDIVLPKCPSACKLFLQGCTESCKQALVDFECSETNNGKNFEGSCGCYAPEPWPPNSAVGRWTGSFVLAAGALMMMLL